MTEKKEWTDKELMDSISKVIEKIGEVGIDDVIKTGVVLSHIDGETPIDNGIEVMVGVSPEVRVNTYTKEVHAFNGMRMFKKYD